MKEINLLPQKNVNVLQQQRTIVIVRAVAIFSVVIFLVSWIGIFLLAKNYSVDSVNAQQNAMRAKLSPYTKKAVSYLTLYNRVSQIQHIIKTRSLLTSTIATLEKQVPTDVTLQSIAVTQETASLAVTSPSLSSLKAFLDNMTSLYTNKKIFKTLTISNVVVNAKTGVYSVAVNGGIQ